MAPGSLRSPPLPQSPRVCLLFQLHIRKDLSHVLRRRRSSGLLDWRRWARLPSPGARGWQRRGPAWLPVSSSKDCERSRGARRSWHARGRGRAQGGCTSLEHLSRAFVRASCFTFVVSRSFDPLSRWTRIGIWIFHVFTPFLVHEGRSYQSPQVWS